MPGWKDGQPYSDKYGDVYFSADSGLEETRHVFLRGNRLAARFRSLAARASFCIGETGFGTGLNFLAAWQMFDENAPAGASLDFFSVESAPLRDDELARASMLWPELGTRSAALSARWRRRVPQWNRWTFAGGRVRLTLALCDVAEALPQLPAGAVDAWFLDGFAPSKNPEMWSDPVLAHVARTSRSGATLSTYTSAGWVRRSLQRAGFTVTRAPGFGRKREMVQGVLRHEAGLPLPATRSDESLAVHRGSSDDERHNGERTIQPAARSAPDRLPHTALVIGGGIAGCAAAYALAQRGVPVTLIERGPRLAQAATGNPRAVLYARLGASPDPLHRFVLAAYGHALGLLDDVLPVDQDLRGECGLLQLAFDDAERKRIARLTAAEWPAHVLQIVDDRQATQLAGIAMTCGGVWFPAGGWVVPAALTANLAAVAHVTCRLGHAVETLQSTAAGWRVGGHDIDGNHWSAESEVVLVCCGNSAKDLAPLAHVALTAARGQITFVPATEASRMLRTVVCGGGYCAPERDGMHLVGATHGLGDASTEMRRVDHIENLSNLAAFAPHVRDALGDVNPDGLSGRASVRCSAPGAMPLVGRVDEGLYCSLAHGTRGMITAGLAGEALAARICGQLPPLPEAILAALAPVPRARGTSMA